MAGTNISIDVTDKEVRQLLQRLTAKLGTPNDALEGIGAYVLGSVQQNFEEQGRPAKWSSRNDKAPHPLLQKSNRLFNSISYKVDDDSVAIGTNVIYAAIHQNVIYAAIHQFGGETGRDGETTITARPYLMLQEEDNAAIIELLEDYIEEVTK